MHLGAVFGFAGLDYGIRFGHRWGLFERSRWLQRWTTTLIRGIGFNVKVIGELPDRGFVTPNHLGYMDILVMSSVMKLTFLSKSEVKDWPVIGTFTQMAGTVFIDRSRKREVANKDESFAAVIEQGTCLTLFLEGTSTNGNKVLPYRSSLLQPMVENNWPITPAYIEYECEGGDAANEVCWWGDAEFTPHFFRLLGVRKTNATIVFGKTRNAGESDRKGLAIELREEVLELKKIAKQRSEEKGGGRSVKRHPVL